MSRGESHDVSLPVCRTDAWLTQCSPFRWNRGLIERQRCRRQGSEQPSLVKLIVSLCWYFTEGDANYGILVHVYCWVVQPRFTRAYFEHCLFKPSRFLYNSLVPMTVPVLAITWCFSVEDANILLAIEEVVDFFNLMWLKVLIRTFWDQVRVVKKYVTQSSELSTVTSARWRHSLCTMKD